MFLPALTLCAPEPVTRGKEAQVPWVVVNSPGPIWGGVLDKRPADGATFRAEAGGEGLSPGDAVRLSSR